MVGGEGSVTVPETDFLVTTVGKVRGFGKDFRLRQHHLRARGRGVRGGRAGGISKRREESERMGQRLVRLGPMDSKVERDWQTDQGWDYLSEMPCPSSVWHQAVMGLEGG